MKKCLILFLSLTTTFLASAQQYSGLWKFTSNIPAGKPVLVPEAYLNVVVDEGSLAGYLSTVGMNANVPHVLDLPQPDGTFRSFYIWETPMMEQPLYDKYPQIRTYTASAIDNHLVTAKIDRTPFGFHAMIDDGKNTFFIDPFGTTANGSYITYYRRDYYNRSNKGVICGVHDNASSRNDQTYLTPTGLPPIQLRTNGTTRKSYRLALACTGEYAVAVAGLSPTKGAVLAKMVTSINRVNSVYEREVAATMQLVGNDDTLIYLDGNNDPYSNTVAGSMLTQNQNTVDTRIGPANYDIGHVFGTGGGGSGAGLGLAAPGACQDPTKAWGVTGIPNPTGDAFDIDYVAHEMGHQFGASHTFNNSTSGACSGSSFVPATAYEPGSGSTIMGYAGICGAEDIQPHTDPYFHSASLEQITTYIAGSTCGIISATPNVSATVAAFTTAYNIPYFTAFELTAPQANDNTADTLTYCWEERDLGDYGRTISQTRIKGPLFRSFRPTTDRTRIFPSIDSLLKSVFFSKQEKVPDTARTLCFRLTVRDIYQGFGCFNFPNDSILLHVIRTGEPFKVTAPNATVNWPGGTSQTVTWNVANTDQPPISCANVDIYLSTDGGYTFPVLLLGNTPNDGSETVTLPNGNMSNMRIKVKGVNNVFFAISHVTVSTFLPYHPVPTPGVNIFPVPAHNIVTISFVKRGERADAKIVNILGQTVWKGNINDHETIDISKWAKGLYYVKLINSDAIDVRSPIRVD